MATSTYKQRSTPGVYVTELDAFPPSVVGVETAVPAFIGYTAQAEINGKSVYNQSIKINSLVDYQAIFGAADKPMYNIVTSITDASGGTVNATEENYDFRVFDSAAATPAYIYYFLEQTDTSSFNLYDSMRLFFANGGGKCYVVSIGPYSSGSTIKKADLSRGLSIIEEQDGPTMLAIPDATLLPSSGTDKWESDDFKDLTQEMLEQCYKLQDRVAILDVYGSEYVSNPDPIVAKQTLASVVDRFHVDVGDKYLNYGMAYFPFLKTSVVAIDEFSYLNVDAASSPTIEDVLNMQNVTLNTDPKDPTILTAKGDLIALDILKIATTQEDPEAQQLNQNLSTSLPILGEIQTAMLGKNDVLPCSGAMAGVFTTVDNTRGVWNAPANISLSSVKALTYKLDNEQQGDLNRPVNGKAIDAIREFTGRGPVVWGARTLDGNSNDWRYIQVRRTLIYIEQSTKKALDPFVFSANDGNTWTKVTSMVSSFLQGLWSQGGLLGASADEAFSVECGLGSTMTGQDILDGYMIVQITLQMIRPAEFIELTFKQKMDGVN